jgi:di/tricarboxylate transporter
MAATIPVYFAVLIWISPPEVKSIIGGTAYFRSEKQALGPMSRGEKNVVFVLIVMLVLWFLPAFVEFSALDIWYVPSVGMVLLFLLPIDTRKGEMTLNSKDFQNGVLWNVLFPGCQRHRNSERAGGSGRNRLDRRYDHP